MENQKPKQRLTGRTNLELHLVISQHNDFNSDSEFVNQHVPLQFTQCWRIITAMSFNTELKRWIKDKKLTQIKAATTLNVPFRTFQDWLGGRVPHPDRQAAVRVRMSSQSV